MKTINEPNTLPDIEVINEILGGKVALFEILIRRNNPYIYKVGRFYGYNHEDVQDLMQDTFVNAYTNLSKFQNRSSFKTWLIRIMLNNCYARKQKFGFKNETATGKITEKTTPMYSHENAKNTEMTLLNKELSRLIEKAKEQEQEE